ncbi:hypothetical protein CCACVL1_22382 [Corchorus capsularis]|uniref:DUF4283 domain-containing protein n=1 Tax=Corchorus capsularis TaxID=210143 RepID=A0A1R3H040_COCAP|nr:hypothetical protein CCACVL1_22382 [Corchorus capsularis]
MEDLLTVELDFEKEVIRETTQFGLIGKIIADRVLNRKGVRNIIQSIWPAKALLKVFDLGPNLYGFSFADRKSMEMALLNGPWTVMGHCLSMKRWDSELAARDIRFEEVNFWIQV